jgi:hypothetical protein
MSMLTFKLNEFAQALAVYARAKMGGIDRGALLIRCSGEAGTIAAIFGNDNYLADEKVRREVTIVRNCLRQAQLQELGFGLSHDGHSWTLLIRTMKSTYQTEVGRQFQIEMLKVFLDDIVWRSWWDACGVAPDSPERLESERYHWVVT